MSKIYNEALEKIKRGQSGLNAGLSHGFDRLNSFLPGIQQGTYYLIGAETSTGKTAFIDEFFLFNPYDHIHSGEGSQFSLRVIYFSFEIDNIVKITKAIARRLFMEYHVLTDVNMILSRGKNRCSDEIYEFVKKTRNYFEKFEDSVYLFDRNQNPTGIYKYLHGYSKQNGVWEESEWNTTYTPNNPNEYVIVIIDHVGLAKKERGYSSKDNIDKISEYLIWFRNKCNYIPVVVQQLNRDVSSADRFQIKRVEPQLSDFKGTGNTQEDANVVMSLFNPARYDLQVFRGYDVLKLGKMFRSLHVLKNRDGEADLAVGMRFIGEIGHFSELPPARQMQSIDYEQALIV